jgi:hypothetical protein
MKGPVLVLGGLFHFHVEILGLDNDKNIFGPQKPPIFECWRYVSKQCELPEQRVQYYFVIVLCQNTRL